MHMYTSLLLILLSCMHEPLEWEIFRIFNIWGPVPPMINEKVSYHENFWVYAISENS